MTEYGFKHEAMEKSTIQGCADHSHTMALYFVMRL